MCRGRLMLVVLRFWETWSIHDLFSSRGLREASRSPHICCARLRCRIVLLRVCHAIGHLVKKFFSILNMSHVESEFRAIKAEWSWTSWSSFRRIKYFTDISSTVKYVAFLTVEESNDCVSAEYGWHWLLFRKKPRLQLRANIRYFAQESFAQKEGYDFLRFVKESRLWCPSTKRMSLYMLRYRR